LKAHSNLSKLTNCYYLLIGLVVLNDGCTTVCKKDQDFSFLIKLELYDSNGVIIEENNTILNALDL
jgi:hypothetical protein